MQFQAPTRALRGNYNYPTPDVDPLNFTANIFLVFSSLNTLHISQIQSSQIHMRQLET
jgi:hypothetical protein